MQTVRELSREDMWDMQHQIDAIRAAEPVHRPMKRRDREQFLAHQHDPGEAAARHALTAIPADEGEQLDESIYDPKRGVSRKYEYTKAEWDEWWRTHGKK